VQHTDRGCQYASESWTSVLKQAGVKISMDGKGCWVDNVFVERLWRSLKYEDIYLHEYLDVVHLAQGVGRWLLSTTTNDDTRRWTTRPRGAFGKDAWRKRPPGNRCLTTTPNTKTCTMERAN
jgi:transposase InsO family protein